MTRLIIDGNAVLNQALLRGVDHDQGRIVEHEGKQVQVNSADYGINGFFDKYTAFLSQFEKAPRETIIVWDGAGAKALRRTFLPTYKVGRDKAPEVSAELNKARDAVTDMLLKLGAHVVVQHGVEGDDVIAYLCKHLRTQRNVVVTVDGDLSRLVDDNTDVWCGGELNKNPYGPFPHKYITLYKALVGDTSDKIPGAKGFGDVAFVKLVAMFGLEGLDEMERLIVNGKLHELKESVADLPVLQKVLDAKDMVATSWRVASFMLDSVNRLSRPLDWRAGMVAQWDELDDTLRVHALKQFYGTKTLVTAANYAAVYKRLAASPFDDSPFVALDIETSSSEESDEWIERVNSVSEKSKGDKIDVLGHELTGMSLTFGVNSQHTIYMSVDHADTDNITVDQCREMVELIPQTLHIIIQNRNFEFSVLYRTWGDLWKDNGWHGFIPNALDTKIGASYVDENLPKGLKFRSKLHLGYEQATYEQTTTFEGPLGSLTPGGQQKRTWERELEPAQYSTKCVQKIDPDTGEVTQQEVPDKLICPAVTETWEARQYKMNELTAQQVFDYGCDDTICTAALHTYYQQIMELEGTWQTYLDVETLPEYLTTLAFVQGTRVSIAVLRDMEKHDDETYDREWSVLRDFLLKKGWEGTVCPVFDELTPAAVKEAAALLLDTDEVQFTTKKRKLNAMVADMREQFPDNDLASVLALMVETGDVKGLNALVKSRFTGEPKINFGSPKQLQHLFYNVIGLTPKIFNAMTARQREENEAMRSAFKKARQAKEGKSVEYSAEEREALVSKASTDSDAVDTALASGEGDEETQAVLRAYKNIRTVMTRRSLFYKPYRVLTHWRDGRIHPSLNQAEAVTRRYSSSSPNIQQLPKLGEGGQFRKVILPHRKDAVVVSCDFAAQEIRALAWLSKDEALLSCYLGEVPQDMHSLTAVSAAPLVWHEEVTYDEFRAMLESKDPEVKARAKALRGQSKTTFFGAAYGAAAPKIAQTLMVEESVAQAFLDAKDKAFPRIEEWKREVEAEAARCGYAVTMLGARRHLKEQLNAENKWDRARGERQVGNYAIQGSCAEQTKLAMAEMWRRGLFDGRYDVEFIATIHDECVASVHRKDVVPFLREFHDCMQTPYGGMGVPNVSSISLGPSFGEQREMGEVFDAKAVQEAVDELFGGAS